MLYWPFALIFFFCYFGEMINGEFAELYDVITQSNWYLYDIEIQRMIPIILAGTQNPPVLKGFGNVMCTRDSFQKVK